MNLTNRSLPRHRHPLRLTPSGFTLSELLVAAALGLIVVSAAGSVIVQHVRTTTVQAVQLRFQNDWGRVSQLIETEVAEGVSLTANPGVGCGTGTRLFTINIPAIVGITPAPSDTTISYNQAGADLVRCGRPVNNDGTLDLATAASSVTVLRNAVMNINILNDRLVEYNLTFTDPSPPAFSAPFSRTFPGAGQFVQARTKVNYID